MIKEIKCSLNAFEIYMSLKDYYKDIVLLDSSKECENLSRYSFLGVNKFKTFSSKGRKVYINNEYICEGNPFEELQKVINEYSYEEKSEFPLYSGAIGYFSYDIGRVMEEIPNTSKEDMNIPDCIFNFYDNIIIFDLINKRTFITSRGILENEKTSIEKVEEKIINGVSIKEEDFIEDYNVMFESNFTKENYIKAIERIKEYIRSGDVYIANMTQRFKVASNKEHDEIYKRLRSINKAPFSALMDFDDFQIISSSPERFISVRDGILETSPIKGTRRRGENEEEDELLKAELRNSEKDKSELLMIVDLERNDLSRVCKPKTVKVTELFKIEEYATVFHLVSSIKGELKESGKTAEYLGKCFPGGSITGAPKIRAMEIIEELEGLKRSIYTGAIGYFDFNGNCDFNIAIRTIVKKGNECFFGVGGGITIESVEEDEYVETLDKAKALMRVLR
ncbi:MAG: aminodeoxychorismate synthase component I [Clostridium sp.]